MRDIVSDLMRWQRDGDSIALVVMAEVVEAHRKRDQVPAAREADLHPVKNKAYP